MAGMIVSMYCAEGRYLKPCPVDLHEAGRFGKHKPDVRLCDGQIDLVRTGNNFDVVRVYK